jgi:CheY-like chemotaxis protein
MHRTYIADIERGARNITLRSIESLARALQVTVERLLFHSDEANRTSHDWAGGPIGEILLVEDNEHDARMTMRAFQRAKLSNPVRVFTDGESTLDYLTRKEFEIPRPQLLLLDLSLPGISGVEVLRRIKGERALAGIPVVVLANSGDDRHIAECHGLGAGHYIVKPIEFESFSRITPNLNFHWTLTRPALLPALG